MDPFLDIGMFAVQYRKPLDDGQMLEAERLLQVVSDWIRARKSDVDALAAEQVVFEVVRDAVKFGGYQRLTRFHNTTGTRTESGEFDEEQRVVDSYLTAAHKQLLGIAALAEPAFCFPECDY